MASKGFFSHFDDVWMLDGVRTPMVDYCGALGHISPTDLGIKVAKSALERTGVAGEHIGPLLLKIWHPETLISFSCLATLACMQAYPSTCQP